MTQIADLEMRITAALSRIGTAVEGLALAPPLAPPLAPVAPPLAADQGPPPVAEAPAGPSPEVVALCEALELERTTNAQLSERVRALRERQDATVATLERQIERLTAQTEKSAVEMQRLRRTNIALRETVRSLRDLAAPEVPDAHLINRAMEAELEALRATRQSEIAEIEEILVELDAIITEEETTHAGA